uniref:Uncharacterized protein n=1 Tax=Monopterus albus TaxID=43700 RepID=A0A3Q3K460_MONAL
MTTLHPAAPTPKTINGLSISWGLVKRSIASRTMVKHSAVRKTALTRAPITSARIQPKVFLLVELVFSANRTATRATTTGKLSTRNTESDYKMRPDWSNIATVASRRSKRAKQLRIASMFVYSRLLPTPSQSVFSRYKF